MRVLITLLGLCFFAAGTMSGTMSGTMYPWSWSWSWSATAMADGPAYQDEGSSSDSSAALPASGPKVTNYPHAAAAAPKAGETLPPGAPGGAPSTPGPGRSSQATVVAPDPPRLDHPATPPADHDHDHDHGYIAPDTVPSQQDYLSAPETARLLESARGAPTTPPRQQPSAAASRPGPELAPPAANTVPAAGTTPTAGPTPAASTAPPANTVPPVNTRPGASVIPMPGAAPAAETQPGLGKPLVANTLPGTGPALASSAQHTKNSGQPNEKSATKDSSLIGGGGPKDKSTTERSSWGTPVWGLGCLALVLGLFFIVVWVMRKAAPRGSAMLPKEVFEVLGRAPLGVCQHVQLMRCGNKLLLVSVTPGGAETLTEVTDPLEVDRIAGICRQAHPKSVTTAFRQVFQQLAPGAPGGAPSTQGPGRGGTSELDNLAPAGTRRKRYRWEEKNA